MLYVKNKIRTRKELYYFVSNIILYKIIRILSICFTFQFHTIFNRYIFYIDLICSTDSILASLFIKTSCK